MLFYYFLSVQILRIHGKLVFLGLKNYENLNYLLYSLN